VKELKNRQMGVLHPEKKLILRGNFPLSPAKKSSGTAKFTWMACLLMKSNMKKNGTWARSGVERRMAVTSDVFLKEAEFIDRQINSAKINIFNRIVEPCSENEVINWAGTVALDELLGIQTEFSTAICMTTEL
jgi:hypothetical protein